jgi:hypothetical protein
MSAYENPIGRRTVLKALAAVPVLASPLTAGSTGHGSPADHPPARGPRPSAGTPALAHETLIGVL